MPAAGAIPTRLPSARGRPAISDATAVPCGSWISPPAVTAVPPTTRTPPPWRETPESSTATLTPAPARVGPPTSSWASAIRSRSSGALGSVVATTSSPTSSHSTLSSARPGAAYDGGGGSSNGAASTTAGARQAPHSHGLPLGRTGGQSASATDRLTPWSKSLTHESGTTGAAKPSNPRLSAASGPTSG